jgi:hypothetical protein
MPKHKREDRARREREMLRVSLDQAIEHAERKIDQLENDLKPLAAVRAAVMPGMMKVLDDFYAGARFAVRNQFDGEINGIKARLERLHKEIAVNQAARDELGDDECPTT